MRHMYRSLLRFFAPCVLFLALGCGSEEEEEETRVPAALAALESLAEDAFDQALSGDRETVAKTTGELAATWQDYRGSAEKDGVPSTAILELEAAITALNASTGGLPTDSELARKANAVSKPMSQFFDVYDPAVPTPLLTLDYMGREVLLDAKDGDLARAQTDVDAIDSTWQGLRPEVVSAGGSTAAASFDTSIQTERADIVAADTPQLEVTASAQLELVDEIEQVFAAAGDPAD